MINFFEKNKTILVNLLDSFSIAEFKKCADSFKKYKNNKKNKIILFGNGGSASICNHVSVDLSKNARVKATTFNEANLITCLSNDYGHDNWMKEALKIHCEKKDLVVFVSSSGNSKNIVNAAKWCKKNNIKIITFTGFSKNNLLNKINKNGISFWVNSKAYNHVEMCHLYLLLSTVDFIIGKLEYRFN